MGGQEEALPSDTSCPKTALQEGLETSRHSRETGRTVWARSPPQDTTEGSSYWCGEAGAHPGLIPKGAGVYICTTLAHTDQALAQWLPPQHCSKGHAPWQKPVPALALSSGPAVTGAGIVNLCSFTCPRTAAAESQMCADLRVAPSEETHQGL